MIIVTSSTLLENDKFWGFESHLCSWTLTAPNYFIVFLRIQSSDFFFPIYENTYIKSQILSDFPQEKYTQSLPNKERNIKNVSKKNYWLSYIKIATMICFFPKRNTDIILYAGRNITNVIKKKHRVSCNKVTNMICFS